MQIEKYEIHRSAIFTNLRLIINLPTVLEIAMATEYIGIGIIRVHVHRMNGHERVDCVLHGIPISKYARCNSINN